MSVDPKIYKAVLSGYLERSRQRDTLLAKRREEIYAVIPRAAEIDSDLKNTLMNVARAAFNIGSDPAPHIAALKDRNLSLLKERGELLKAAGFSADYLNPGPACKKCDDTGFVGSSPCSCFLERCAKEQSRELSFILDTQGQTFDNFRWDFYSAAPNGDTGISPRDNMESIYDEACEYARNFGRHSVNLLFCGAPGLGKTFLSSCIAREVAARGFSVVYDTAISVLSTLEREKFSAGDEETRAHAKRYFVCDLLLLDDLGTEMSTSFTSSAVYHLVNTRMMAKKPMIINTNLTPQDMRARYSPQLNSRLLGEFQLRFFFGEDIRRLKKNDEY